MTSGSPDGLEFSLGEEVFRSLRTVIQVGRTSEGQPVIVKSPAAPIPEAAEIARYRRERATLDACAGPGVPGVLGLVERGGTVQLVVRSRGGRSLADRLASGRVPVAEAQQILEEAAAILARVHAVGVIHMDVNPANLVWAGRSGGLQLVDFGNSAREGAGTSFDGTLRYIAPEATGRSGHRVTWRVDLYGLGVTAWHLLVGRAPFVDDDPLALIHAHLARVPDAPHAVNPAVPRPLSAVVMRLLEKDPERRYQSAEGLLADLRRCREVGDGGTFDLGVDDAPPRFTLPERLYGRDADLVALQAALGRAGDGVSLALVGGASGIGKSALVAAFGAVCRGTGARMVTGRFELLGRETPLKAVSEACEALVAGVLGGDETALRETRGTLRKAVGGAADLLARAIPSLRILFSDVPPGPELTGQAATARALQGYAALLAAFARPGQPIVAFLDDLQWADVASLDLVEFLLTSPDLRGLLIVGGYRDDEVGPAHPLSRMCERIAPTRTITRVTLGPLDLTSATALVADACRCLPEEAAPLAEALRERSGGNPFFLRELLRQMADRGVLHREAGGWRWDVDAPGRLAFADNVVAAVLERLNLLPAASARALGVAARIGHRFDVRLLAHALGIEAEEAAQALAPTVEAGLVRPETEALGLLAFGAGADLEVSCRFVHDRVQEAALSLLPAEAAPGVHLLLARRLTRDGTTTPEAMFDALEHFRGAASLLDDGERLFVARRALDASAVAVRSAAFTTALTVCEFGLDLAGRRDPALREALLTRALEVADAAADTGAMTRHSEALIAGASSVAAMAPAYVARIRAHVRAEEHAAAIAMGDEFLARVGRRFYTRLEVLPLLARLARVLWATRGRTVEAIVDGPLATDPTEAAVQAVQIAAAKALVSLHPQAIPLDILNDVDHIVAHGVTPDGLFAWTGWAMLLLEGLHRPDLAARYCEAALARAERMRWGSWVGCAWVYYAVLFQWKGPLRAVGEGLLRTRERSLELGEFQAGLAAGMLAAEIQLFQGAFLSEVEVAFRHCEDLARQYRSLDGAPATRVYQRLVAALQDHPAIPGDEGGADARGIFNEQEVALVRLMEASFLGDRASAGRAASLVPASMNTPLRGPGHYVWWTYQSVALLRAAEAGVGPSRDVRRTVAANRAMIERWSRKFPARHYRLRWIDAADRALAGRSREALALYEAAIQLALTDGVRHDAALMAEQAAELAASTGQHRLAAVFLDEARAGYRQWGAARKEKQLAPARQSLAPATSTASGSTVAGNLDLETLFRASIALSGELRLDRLVAEVVEVTMQNAGATRGFLVVEHQGQLQIAVGRDAGGLDLVAAGTPLSAATALARTVVHYVARTGQQLVLADAAADSRFAQDPHVVGATLSILCAPLDHNGRRTGIIYLENHLATAGFTADRLRTVQVLAAQAAVSLQNASLVDTLEAKVAERTRALEAQHERLLESQRALVQREKMASLGQLVAGVAHELNTPLGAIVASVGNISAALDGTLDELADVIATSTPEELEGLRALLRAAQTSAASVTSREERDLRGKLQAQLEAHHLPEARTLARLLTTVGVTDDVDEHLPLLRGPRAETLLRTAADLASLRRNSGTIRTAADRAAKIVFALKSYAHPGSAGGDPVQASLADNLNTVLTLYSSQMRHGVELVRSFEDPGLVTARHEELNQVWTNLLQNALQAMQYRGRLELRLSRHPERACVEVTDSGPGIPADVLGHIFDPFYTTKGQGEGSGLGRSISREIVERHGGTIRVVSVPGRTVFTVELPIRGGQSGRSAPGTGDHRGPRYSTA